MNHRGHTNAWVLPTLVLVFVSCSVCRGQGIFDWRQSAGINDGKKLCYRNGQEVDCESGQQCGSAPGAIDYGRPGPQTYQQQQQHQPSRCIVGISSTGGIPTMQRGTGAIAGVLPPQGNGQRTAVVFTCNHILRGDLPNITVTLANGTKLPAAVTAQSPDMDFAILEFRTADAESIRYYTLGDSNLPAACPIWWAGYSSTNGYRVWSGGTVPSEGAYIYARDSQPGAVSTSGALAYFTTMDGISGCPFIGKDGKLYGTLNEFIFLTESGKDQRVGGVGVEWIRGFLSGNGYGWIIGEAVTDSQPGPLVPVETVDTPLPPLPPVTPIEPALPIPIPTPELPLPSQPAPATIEPTARAVGPVPGPAIETNPPIKTSDGWPWAGLLTISGALVLGAASGGLPVWVVMAARAARLAKQIRDARTNADATTSASGETIRGPSVPIVIRDDPKPATQTVVRSREFVEVEVPQRRLRALQMAHDEYVRRYPGARSTVETIENYADQFESGLPNP